MTADKARSVPILEPKTLVDGRFEVEKEIGRGGMGVLYRAIDVHLQRPCALKLLRGKYSHDRERLRREAAALAAVRNEHVVDVYTFGLHQEIPYFAMEFVVGMNLAAIVREHAAHNNVFVPIRRAVQILCDLCDALSAIHKVGIVHRDVKPDNVIVEDHTGRSVLVDFGTAALGDDGDEIVGTPGYFAPETLFTPKSTPAQDLYSFGCLAFQLLTNKPPYAGREFEELLRQHAKAPIPKPSLLRAELAPFDELFTELLAKDPADRLSNAAIVRNALEDRLSIALAASPVESAAHEPIAEDSTARRGAGSLRVLVVDDDPLFARIATRCALVAFSDIPVAVAKANTAKDAIASIEQKRPDIVVLDYHLPDGNGLDVLTRLRAERGGANTDVIVASNFLTSAPRWRFDVLGVREFVEKPVDFAALVAVLQKIAVRRGWLGAQAAAR
ncbi:MAG: protein kinase [Polyangiales bacterium]